ncbi:MFS transporter [Microbacterium sp. X-17]|uniref:MFS transporter n=1 Tax=Microbacterium sp. X-17 TaxID=3144404 RepID=UPI0031F519EB
MTTDTRRSLGRTSLAILALGTFALGIDGYVLSGLLPQVASSLHVSQSTAGQLTTLFALVYAVGSPVIATVAGRWDRRVLLAAGMTVFVAGVILQAVGPIFVLVAIGRVVAALGAAGYQATAYSTAGILSDDKHRASALAVVAAGSSVALIAGLPFGILVGQALGWRATMWILVCLGVISIAAVWLLPSAHAPKLSLRARAGALTDRRVLKVLAGTVVVLTPGFLVIAYLPAILNTGGPLVVVTILGYGIGQVCGTATAPKLINRYGPRTSLVVGAVGVTVASAGLILTRTTLVPAVITMAVLGLSVGLTVVPQQHRLFATVPELAPVAVGLNGSAIYIASAVGAGIGGIAIAGGAETATMASAIIGVLAIALAMFLAPERGRARRDAQPST